MRHFIVLSAAAITLAGCAAQPFGGMSDPVPGFWWGAFHGLIAPFSLAGSFFDPSIRAYAIPNMGGWYDFGFVFGMAVLFGGSAAG